MNFYRKMAFLVFKTRVLVSPPKRLIFLVNFCALKLRHHQDTKKSHHFSHSQFFLLRKRRLFIVCCRKLKNKLQIFALINFSRMFSFTFLVITQVFCSFSLVLAGCRVKCLNFCDFLINLNFFSWNFNILNQNRSKFVSKILKNQSF